MSFDALALAAVLAELAPLVVDSRVQKIVFVDEVSLALETFAPGVGRIDVLVSAHPEHARVQRIGTSSKLPARGIEGDSPFSLLIRKHLRNARIRSITQPRLERLFEIDCEQRDASGRVSSVRLIVETMGRRSNLILVGGDGNILDAARRSPPSRNPRRPVLPHNPYVAPPAQDRLMPEALTAEALAARANSEPSLSKLLANSVAGLSPLAAREIAFRATGTRESDTRCVEWIRVAEITRAFVEPSRWEPCVAYEAEAPLEFAAYALTHLTSARLQRFETVSAAMEAFYARIEATRPRRGDTLAPERKSLLASLERASRSAERRIAGLRHQLDIARSEREPLRRVGEALLAQQRDIVPGAGEVMVDGQAFELDPRLSAVENAQAYFARYRKAREAEERVPQLLQEAQTIADHLANLRALVELADGVDAIRALRREVGLATGGRPPRSGGSKQGQRSAPYRKIALGPGWEALVGSSAEGNAWVTFDLAGGDDLWLHARGVPGAHVVVRTGGREPPEAVVQRAAQVAAEQSSARGAAAVEVDVARRRYVKKIPGGPPGLVRYTHERTVRVTPRSAQDMASSLLIREPAIIDAALR